MNLKNLLLRLLQDHRTFLILRSAGCRPPPLSFQMLLSLACPIPRFQMPLLLPLQCPLLGQSDQTLALIRTLCRKDSGHQHTSKANIAQSGLQSLPPPPPPTQTKRLSSRTYFAHFIDHLDPFVVFLETVTLHWWQQTVDNKVVVPSDH